MRSLQKEALPHAWEGRSVRDGGRSDPGDPHVQRRVTEAWGEEVFPKLTFSEAELWIGSRWGDLVGRSHMAVGPGHQGLNQVTIFIQFKGNLEKSSHKDRKLKMHSEWLLREQDTGEGRNSEGARRQRV